MIRLKNNQGFTIIEVMFFVLVGAIIVGGAYYVGSQKDKKDSGSSLTTGNQSDSRKSFPRAGVSIDNKYDWEIEDSLTTDKIGDQEVSGGTLVFKLPSGANVEFRVGTAGFGGECEPGSTDKFHEKAECPTQEFLSRTKVTGPYTSNDYSYVLNLYHRYDTERDGTHNYSLCLSSDAADGTFPKELNKPEFGIGIPCVFSNNEGDIFMDITGIDNSTPQFFDNADIKQIEEVLKTIQVL